MKELSRVKAVIDLDAIYENVFNAKKLLADGTGIMGVIKADGYGHGAVQVAKTIDELVSYYGIAVLEEGIELRKNGIKTPMLILGYTNPLLYEDMIEYDIDTAVFTMEMAEKISETAVKARKEAGIHIAIDTGMSRIGFDLSDESIDKVVKISKLPNVRIDGMFTHFATMDEKDKSKAFEQFDKYMDFNSRLEKKGIHIPIKHVSNSAGITEAPQAHLDMVRDGICVYGLYPSDDVDKAKLPLKPAMEIKSYVSFVKTIPAGTHIGYGATFTADKEMTIATIPIGYADGYPRSLSNLGWVLIRGKKAPITGRVCMDQMMVDVSDIPNVTENDEVTLVGRDGDEFISVEEISNLAGSFNYEFVCDVGKRVPREYIKNGERVAIGSYFKK